MELERDSMDWPPSNPAGPDDDPLAGVRPTVVGTASAGAPPTAYEWIHTRDGWVAVSRDEPSAWDEADDGAGVPGGDEAGSLLAGIPVRRRRRGLGRDVFEALCMAGLLFLGIQGVMRQFVVENISMLPTLDPGDRIFVDRLSWRGVADLARGDVVVFRAWDEDKLYVKRVIGLPGDTLAMQDGDVFVNGERLDEPYLVQHADESKPVVTLGPDEYFVMGDNRPSSADSRLHGPVKRASIVGRAWAIFWPLGDAAWLHKTPRLYAAPLKPDALGDVGSASPLSP